MPQQPTPQRGIVLPMALIMLVIISFAGLMAARNSATFEQFSNNLRTTQVARLAAEDALRQCERIAKAKAEAEDDPAVVVPDDAAKISETEIAADDDVSIKGGLWNTKASWADGADNLITVVPTYGENVQDEDGKNPRLKNSPTCIIQTMVNDRFLVTSRGLSNDAQVDENGVLTAGSEVWLQSILTPAIPMLDDNGGWK
ncbi:pilus assembly PilX family protein [Hydrogenophaga luteola]|uniref:Type 4 fimbrial biogenesis protein PilX N-terminal domain-containing protein n=1 Tax=Hydrogenophaga luteola TaxID=1591122 RepID=A0ABV7W848_9BURK